MAYTNMHIPVLLGQLAELAYSYKCSLVTN